MTFIRRQIPWNKGKKTGIKPWQGKHRSEATKKKIRETNKRKGIKPPITHRKGDKNPAWKGGVSKKDNYKSEYANKYWRKNRAKKYWQNLQRRIKRLKAEGSHTLGEWELLKRQYGYCCPSCGKCEPKIILTEDHIIPLSKGGSDYIDNIQPLCKSCNAKKHTKIIKY